MKNDKLALVISILSVFILLIGFSGFGYLASTDYFKGNQGDSIKGDTGDPGYTPIYGIDYHDGIDGSAPAHEWNGTRIRFMNPDGSWGAWVDLKGEKGNTGSRGPAGKDADAPVNHLPVIGLLNLSNCSVGKCGTYFLINISISDVDTDLLHAVIHYRFCNESDWKTAKEVYGFDGYVSACVYSSLKKPVTCFWFVEVFDGSESVFRCFNDTVG
jgi:hypothetical protein